MTAIHAWGSEEQKRHRLPPMAAGTAVGCFGLTEPDAGSNPAEMRTTARRDGPDWILDGAKRWIGMGSIADVAVVWARTDDGCRGFLVPAGTAGFTARDIEGKRALRASLQSELHFEGCRVPDDARLPGAGAGAARSVHVPERGPLRRRVGRRWRRAQLLRGGTAAGL